MQPPIPPHHIANLPMETIAIAVPPLPSDVDLMAVYPYLYQYGLAPMTDAEGQVVRYITDIKLVDDHPTMIDSPMTCLPFHETVAQAQALFDQSTQRMIPLLDAQGRYCGYCASKLELYRLWAGQTEIPKIGGLATPLGVYLTTGLYSAGAGSGGLILTGMLFASYMVGAKILMDWANTHYGPLLASWVPVSPSMLPLVEMLVLLSMLLLLIRISPLSGLHAAEHQVIHVIEKGLPLTHEQIRQQPRAHSRCGTNFMVALIGLEGIAIGTMMLYAHHATLALGFLVVSGLSIGLGWKQLGMALQGLFTTSAPSPWQIESALTAGKSLLEQFRLRPHGNPNFWQRLLGSGLFQVLGSFLFTLWLLRQVLTLSGL